MKRITISILLMAMLLGCMIFIFSMSAEPAEISGETSGNTIRKVFNLIYPGFRDMTEAEQNVIIEDCQHIVRKLAHFSIYTVLGILLALNTAYHIKRIWLRNLISITVGILYAVSDEVHQTYVPGRSGQLSDVLLDSAGVVLGCVFIFFIITLIRKKHNISNKRKKAD